MGYVYASLWFLVGGYLLYNGIKQFKVLRLFGSYFIFLGLWWTANELMPNVDLINDHPYALILRLVSVIMIALGLWIYIKSKKSPQKEQDVEQNKDIDKK